MYLPKEYLKYLPEREVVKKPLQILNRFIPVRCFNLDDRREIFKLMPEEDRRKITRSITAYKEFIIGICLDGADKLKGRLTDRFYKKPEKEARDILFELCTTVNEELSLEEVTVLDRKKQEKDPERECTKRILIPDFKSLEQRLNEELISQEDTTRDVLETLMVSQAGLADEHKPLGSFLLAGRTGTGKTYFGKLLAKKIRFKLIQVNGAEYTGKDETPKLLGCAPGYIGYEDPPLFTNKELKKAVIIWDEIEKAHPTIHNLLLGILEEGFARSGSGEKLIFSNTINILTTNIGVETIDKYLNAIGFSQKREVDREILIESILGEIKKFFRPEFLNRVDGVYTLNTLNFNDCCNVTRLQLSELERRLKRKEISLHFPDSIIKKIVTLANYREYGAREIKRVIEKRIKKEIAEVINKKTEKLTSVEINPGPLGKFQFNFS